MLLSYVLPELESTCSPIDQVYDSELASIECGAQDLPFTYSLFGSFADMAAGYNEDLNIGEFPPEQGGTCSEANYEAAYAIDGAPVGRVNCRAHRNATTGDLYHVMEWTSDELKVIGYFSNREDLHTWAELIQFWQEQAGPFAP